MIAQSKQLEVLVLQHKEWVELYNKLKGTDEGLGAVETDLKKSLQDIKKFSDNLKQERKTDFDEFLSQIQKSAKKNTGELGEVAARLDAFEKSLAPGQNQQPVASADELVFIKREVTRLRGCVGTSKALTTEILDDAAKVKMEKTYSLDDLYQLRQSLQTLKDQESVDIPKLRKNLDNLEGFNVKSLRNTLNDDNKKSQNQIFRMKKNFEDLQVWIDKLNTKIADSQRSLDDLLSFSNEDLERDNEVNGKLLDKFNEYVGDVNEDSTNSLYGQKKVIIA